jgi:hexokinase
MGEITGAAGSMADVPRDLLDQINKLEEQFTVPGDQLKAISAHFVNELTKGLTVEGGSIVGQPFHQLGV